MGKRFHLWRRSRRRLLGQRMLAWLRGRGRASADVQAGGGPRGAGGNGVRAGPFAAASGDAGSGEGPSVAGNGVRGADMAVGVEATLRDVPLDQMGVEARMMLSPKRMRVALRKVYKWGDLLGTGGFAAVRQVTHKRSGERCACKVMRLPDPDAPPNELSRAEVFREIEILSKTNHPNVLSLREFYVGKEMVYIVTELLEGGMLLDALLERKEHRYTEDDARIVFRQLLEGVGYLHDRDVAHRDLKLENLLLVEKGNINRIKIVDFGLAKRTVSKMSTAAGTPQFVAPEVLRRDVQTYDKSVDMWSAGVILYILLAGFPPFYDANEAVMYSKIRQGLYSFADPVWSSVTPAAKDLVSQLLQVNPTQRLNVRQAKQHEWMMGDLLSRAESAPLVEAHAKLAHPKLLKAAGMVVMAINGLMKEQLELIHSTESNEASGELSMVGLCKDEGGVGSRSASRGTEGGEPSETGKSEGEGAGEMSLNLHSPPSTSSSTRQRGAQSSAERQEVVTRRQPRQQSVPKTVFQPDLEIPNPPSTSSSTRQEQERATVEETKAVPERRSKKPYVKPLEQVPDRAPVMGTEGVSKRRSKQQSGPLKKASPSRPPQVDAHVPLSLGAGAGIVDSSLTRSISDGAEVGPTQHPQVPPLRTVSDGVEFTQPRRVTKRPTFPVGGQQSPIIEDRVLDDHHANGRNSRNGLDRSSLGSVNGGFVLVKTEGLKSGGGGRLARRSRGHRSISLPAPRSIGTQQR